MMETESLKTLLDKEENRLINLSPEQVKQLLDRNKKDLKIVTGLHTRQGDSFPINYKLK